MSFSLNEIFPSFEWLHFSNTQLNADVCVMSQNLRSCDDQTTKHNGTGYHSIHKLESSGFPPHPEQINQLVTEQNNISIAVVR